MMEKSKTYPKHDSNALNQSFNDWDAGFPSDELWLDLEAELSADAVWSNLSESIENDHQLSDETLFQAYEKWEPNPSYDLWSKIDEQLSRERVWIRLTKSLLSIETVTPWMKMAASTILFVLIAFFIDQSTTKFPKTWEITHALQSQQVGKNQSIHAHTAQQNVVENAGKNLDIPTRNYEKPHLASSDNTSVQEHTNAQQTSNALIAFDEIESIPAKHITLTQNHPTDFTWIPQTKTNFKPRFTISVGSQCTFINEDRKRVLNSSLPSMGVSADFQYHAYVKQVRFTQSIGFGQYAQSNGRYLNGRYLNSLQRLNTLYLATAVGYKFNHITLFGGVSLSKLLNGYESNRMYITNVYNSKSVQLGALAGIDYHFKPFKNNTAMGLGLQYNYVSKLKSGNTQFKDMQGINLQVKFSF